MLNQSGDLEIELANSYKSLLDNKLHFRNELQSHDILKKDAEISIVSTYPTTCGIDGSYAIEKLLSTDMVAIAGVAVEGLTPPNEKRHWPLPKHFSKILNVPHSDSTTVVSRAIMMCMELYLAKRAPHDVVFLDGSLTTPFIYFNQALNKLNDVSDKLSNLFDEWFEKGLDSYKEILLSQRSDKIFAGIPKYTTRKEITQNILGIYGHEDRAVLSFILDSGEFVGPIQIQNPSSPWHIDKQPTDKVTLISEIINALERLFIVYYRPFIHLPALRIEIASSIANNQRLTILFESLKMQCNAPGIMEPYPLYLADRMVKHLRTALPAIRKTATQEIALNWEDSLGDIYLAMHGYRTESGK